MTYPVKSPKKLIEVALPLDEINKAAAREKSIRHGHPSTLHLWWARRPLAAARAVIFAQLVNDPSWKWEMENPGLVPPGHLKASWAASRKRLFNLIEELVQWENTTNEAVLERARAEIRKSWREVCELNRDHPQAAELFNPDRLPALHDPFAGGGAIPLEAQRLGLEAYASDLNPVAVLINKAMIEIPPKFAGRPPVSLAAKEKAARERQEHKGKQESLFAPSALSGGDSAWPGATGLAEDVRYYGAWMREEAQKRIGHLYPTVAAVQEADGSWRHATPEDIRHSPSAIRHLTVIAWLWVRTVKSPNPAFSHVDVPLASTFILSSKEGKGAYVQPVIVGDRYEFTVKVGTPPPEAKDGTKLARGANFRCLLSNTAMEGDHIKSEGRAGRMGAKMMAIVAEGKKGRVYLAPTPEMEAVARKAEPIWKPELKLSEDKRAFWTPAYGVTTYGDLFTPRQLVALTTFSDLVVEAREKIRRDALAAGLPDDGRGLDAGGMGAVAYAEAVSVYLAFNVSKLTDLNNNLVTWKLDRGCPVHLFARQAIPMVWDFPEANPFSDSSGSWDSVLWHLLSSMTPVCLPAIGSGHQAIQGDARQTINVPAKVVCTDPPYYDNISYADLSDFFYVWLRKPLRPIYPNLLATIAVPKEDELIASPSRQGSKQKSETYFLEGMTQVMSQIVEKGHPAFPVTIYYAFKQSETETAGTTSTGWETFLEAVLRAGFALLGTWPIRTEMKARQIAMDANALASSIVLVCRKRPDDAPTISRREFLRELNAVLPEALDEMTKGSGDERSPVAPVDLSQAIIGPGMAVFSKYAAVLEADGTPMSVRTALQLINRFLAEDDFDADTQFCLHWFEQHGWREGVYGQADVLARAKGTSVDGMRAAGVVESGGGVVRLRRWSEYPADWDPQTDTRNPVWETLHQLIRALKQEGESGAGRLLAAVKGKAEAARQLAYRLYTLCERQGWAEDARAYNELITSWDGVESAAVEAPTKPVQSSFLE